MLDRRAKRHFSNNDVVFRLGWHVLKNRDFDSRECPIEERDEREKDLFSQGIWTSLPTKIIGIGALKPRLSTVLKDQIASELPSLILDVPTGINESRSRLRRLGKARGTPQEQQSYLVSISQSFFSLVKAAVNGTYIHEFFGDATTDMGFSKRLRAVVQDILLEFAEDMRREGHSLEIIEDASLPKSTSIPKQILRSEFLRNVRELMRRTRGCEVPGTFNPLIIGDLFYQQSRPWQRLVERFSERILLATRKSLELILTHTADEATGEGLLRDVIDPAMETYTKLLEIKVAEIMRPYQKGHPITYNHYFIETVQRARQNHAKKDQARRLNIFFKLKPEMGPSVVSSHQGFSTRELLDALNQQTEAEMNRYACSEAVDCMEAYYKVSISRQSSRGQNCRRKFNFNRVFLVIYAQVAMKVIVDNFAVIGIEHCLLDGLSETFSPDSVMKLDETVMRNIAAETEDSAIERAQAMKKLKSLEVALQTLNRHARQKLTG